MILAAIARLLTIFSLSLLFAPPLHAQSISAKTLIDRSAQAMGGMAALRAIKNQIIESEGKQFDSSSTPKPLGPAQQISTFTYTLTRDLTQPRLRIEWDSRLSERDATVRFVEIGRAHV